MINYSEDQERQYHIQVAKGEVGRYVILPGDPGRCEKIAAYFEEPKLIADNREYVTYTGCLDRGESERHFYGNRRSVRIDRYGRIEKSGRRYFYPCGNKRRNGARCKERRSGGCNRSYSYGGTSKEYAPIEYPAVPDLTVTNAL